MKKLITLLSILVPFVLNAQEYTLISEKDSIPSYLERLLQKRDSTFEISGKHRTITSNINLEFVTSAGAYFTENKLDEVSFKNNRVRLEMYGRLNKHISYHFRQSYTRYTSAIEYANIKWHYKDRFELTAGKQFAAFAGYEGYVNGIKVREFCEFNNYTDIFLPGLMGTYYFSPDQLVMFQIANNKSGLDPKAFPVGVEPTKVPLLATANWNGFFADRTVHLMYSASVGSQAKGKNIYYLMCGNIYEKEPVIAYLDVLYARCGLDSQGRVTALQGSPVMGPVSIAENVQYLSFIANVDYQFHPKWNVYLKGAYETAGIYEANGVFEKGRYITSWNAQACMEWFPFTEDKGFKVFAHYLYKGHSLTQKADALMAVMPHTQRVSIGLQYIIPVL